MRITISLPGNSDRQLLSEEGDGKVAHQRSSLRRRKHEFRENASLRTILSLSCFIVLLSSFVEFGARAQKSNIWQNNACGGGYTESTYGDVRTCSLCSAGSSCDGSSSSGCSTPQWTEGGMGACEPQAAGYGHSSTSSRPSVCASGQQTDSSGNCVSCVNGMGDNIGYQCIDPSNPISCDADYFGRYGYSSGTHCDMCPAGSDCTNYEATDCAGGYGAPQGRYMDEPSGARSCDLADAGQALYSTDMFPFDCVNTVTTAAASTTNACGLCQRGYSCGGDSQAYSIANTGWEHYFGNKYSSEAVCSGNYYENDAGDTVCQDAHDWYQVPGMPNGITMAVCTYGTYTNECDACPEGSSCDFDSTTDCVSGYHSPEGKLANYHTPLGETAVDTTASAACTGDNQYVMYYDDYPNGSSPYFYNTWNAGCHDCQDNYYCSSAGHRTTCQAGEYVDATTGCNTCTAGEECQAMDITDMFSSNPDGYKHFLNGGTGVAYFGAIGETTPDHTVGAAYAAQNAGNPQKYGCPYGYSCENGIHTKCDANGWANWLDGECTTEGFIWARDLGGQDCPTGTTTNSGHDHYCEPCDAGYCESYANDCGNAWTSWYEQDGCQECTTDGVVNWWNLSEYQSDPSTASRFYFNAVVPECMGNSHWQAFNLVPCDPGYYVNNGECHERGHLYIADSDDIRQFPNWTARDGSSRECRSNTVSDFADYDYFYRTTDDYCLTDKDDQTSGRDQLCDVSSVDIGTITGGVDHHGDQSTGGFRVCTFCPLNAICPYENNWGANTVGNCDSEDTTDAGGSCTNTNYDDLGTVDIYAYEKTTPCYGKYLWPTPGTDTNYYLLPYERVQASLPLPGISGWDEYSARSGADQTYAITGLYFDDRRVQWAYDDTTTCLDCNDATMAAGMCQFVAGYFPDHTKAETLSEHIINCPFQSGSRTVAKHSDYYHKTETDGVPYSSVWTQGTEEANMIAATFESYAWFNDNYADQFIGLEYHDQYYDLQNQNYYSADSTGLNDAWNYNPYSYCKIDTAYFAPYVISSHTDQTDEYYWDDVQDDNIGWYGEQKISKYIQQCSIYEWRSLNYPKCRANAPGFYSPGNYDVDSTGDIQNTPTEAPIATGTVFTRVTQMGDHTGVIAAMCPEHAELFQTAGAIDEKQACRLKTMGTCETSSSDFCNGGADFMCPPGWKIIGGSAKEYRDSACTPIPAGEYSMHAASGTTDDSTCPAGYLCPDYTNSATHHPAQGGQYAAAGSSTQSPCPADTFCPGNQGSQTACPDGYYTNSITETDNELGCIPYAAGQSQGSSCGNGNFCPEGTQSANEPGCPAGTYNSSGGESTTQCAANPCPAGSWCDVGSTGSSNSCPDGRICPGGSNLLTTNQDEYPCPAGETSTSGANTFGTCSSSCSQGTLCREGHVSSDTLDTDMCAAAGYNCESGSPFREICDPGTYVSSAAPTGTCASCDDGYACPGADRHACPAGWESSNASSGDSDWANCSPCAEGTFCAGTVGATQGDTTGLGSTGQWTVPGSTSTDLFDIPGGKWANTNDYSTSDGYPAGKLEDCEAGFYCEVGTYAPVAQVLNFVTDETGLAFAKPCPPGYTCDGTAGNPPVLATLNKFGDGQGNNEGDTAMGYYSVEGGTGQYETACEISTYSATAGSDCDPCVDGNYCFGGLEVTCPAGFYCDTAATQADADDNGTELQLFLSCPKGHIRATTGASIEEDVTDTGTGCVKAVGGSAVVYTGATKVQFDDDLYEDTSSISYFDVTDLFTPAEARTHNQSYGNQCGAGYFCYDRGDSTTPKQFCEMDQIQAYIDLETASENSGYDPASPLQVDKFGDAATCNQGVCPLGYYCQKGTVDPTGTNDSNGDAIAGVCPLGKFTESWGVRSTDECLNCNQGYYCTGSESRTACPAGNFCAQDETGLGENELVDWADDSTSDKSENTQAIPGYFTGPQYPAMVPCFPGTEAYEDTDAGTDGFGTAGYQCVDTDGDADGGINTLGTTTSCNCPWCAEFHACPYWGTGEHTSTGGTVDNLRYNCEETGLPDDDAAFEGQGDWFIGRDCSDPKSFIMPLKTPYGYFLFQVADTDWEGNTGTGAKTACREDTYCQGDGVTLPTACPNGFKCNTLTTHEKPYLKAEGGIFENWLQGQTVGEVCTYCDDPSTETYLYGYDGARTVSTYGVTLDDPQENDDADFRLCKKGYYCDAANDENSGGTGREQMCLAGTYMPYYGAETQADCVACQPGYYCPNDGTIVPTECEDTWGYYCPEGTGVAGDKVACDHGYYCPEKAHMQYRCGLGFYTDADYIALDSANWNECEHCPGGSYCIATTSTAVDYDSNPFSGTATPTQCTDEYFCEIYTDANGVEYGSAYPQACSEGFKTVPADNPTGADNEDEDCMQIEYHYWQRMPTGSADGSWVTKGTIENGIAPSTILDGTSSVATAGTDVVPGESDRWATLYGQPCPVGFNCIQGNAVEVPAGRQIDYEWAAYTDAGDSTLPAADADIGTECLAGYYCLEGCSRSRPNVVGDGDAATIATDYDTVYNGNICQSGWFCEAGTGAFTGAGDSSDYTKWGQQCAAGSYASYGKYGLQSQTECNSCPFGKVCLNDDPLDDTATILDGITDTGIEDCLQGYYCNENTGVHADAEDCPLGHFCETGSMEPLPCPKGQYQDATNQYACIECGSVDSGAFYCPYTKIPKATTDVTQYTTAASQQLSCESGHMCETTGLVYPTPCSAGFYQPNGGEADCLVCPARYYCPYEGMDDVTGFECPDQHSCPEGTIAPTLCDDGKWCPNTFTTTFTTTTDDEYVAQTSDGGVDCPAGYYCKSGYRDQCWAGYLCSGGSDTPTPTSGSVGQECPEGGYCLAGATTKTACSDNYYNPSTGGESVDDCQDCPTGFSCTDTDGTILPSSVDCPVGNICGSTNVPCDPGYYCPSGALTMLFCPAGQYQDETEQASCKECPDGKYCEQVIDGGVDNITDTGTSSGCITPQDCPAGHYCPEGTGNYEQFACPPGTYATTTDDSRSDDSDCTACDRGYVCPEYGMIDADSAGNYPCAPGYICDTGSSEVTGTEECPAHHFCPGGSGAAMTIDQCPDGYYSDEKGLSSSDECILCPAGYYCSILGALVSPDPVTGDTVYYVENDITTTACPAGYYCPAGLYDPDDGGSFDAADPTTYSAATSDVGAQCPLGHYCPQASPNPLKCPPGTYSNALEAEECTPCRLGFYCQEPGTEDPTAFPCGANMWCPEGSISPRQCVTSYTDSVPFGSYHYRDDDANPTVDECRPCATGGFCWPSSTFTHEGPISDCLREATDDADGDPQVGGYLCREGSYMYKPLYANVEYIQPNSSTFSSYSGPVLPGYYVDPATGEPVGCAISYFQPGYYTSECFECYEGRYCPEIEMSDLANYKCDAGYVCERGSHLQNPEDGDVNADGNLVGWQCEEKYQCPSNLYHQIECEDGFISEETGLSYCSSCPEGYFCDNGENQNLIKEACLINSNCGGGNPRQPNCPNGLYESAGECMNCTSPNYCRANIIAGPCAAGYQCNETISELGQNSVPNPAGAECPAGTYCNRYDVVPTDCPWETMSVTVGAIQKSDCTDCQPGYVCEFGNSTAYDCPIGHYCPPGGDNGIYNKKMFKCPRGTYNALLRRVYRYECEDCPAGYFCNEEGQTNYTANACPTGHFCIEGSIVPQACPPGTYAEEDKGMEEGDCVPCINGHYCPEGTSSPIKCTPGHYCPGNAMLQITCRGGYYCNEDSKYQEEECPVNFYCPRGSPEAPIPCDNKHTCGWRTEMQQLCAAGFYVQDLSRYGGQNQCKSCAAGFYSTVQTEGCEECTAGYVCYGETNTATPTIFKEHNGELCPKGHFCPPGTKTPVPCPRGYYNINEGLKSREECRLCPAGTYNDEQGALGCKPCGKFATSEEGSEKCTCIGRFRSYSAVDASCRCLSGYSFKNEDLVELGDTSGTEDCALLVRDRCEFGAGDNDLPRDIEGNCAVPDDCGAACPRNADGSEGRGTRSQTLGVCQCEAERPVDEVCNQDCRRNAPKMKYVDGETIEMVYPDGTKERVDLTDDDYQVDVFGDFVCDFGQSCNIITATFTENGPQGTYQPPAFIETGRRRRRLRDSGFENVYNMTRTDLRQLQEEDGPQIVEQQEILNPVYCISEGDSFLFTISSPQNYPVFMRESVMNTNQEFDYGSFLDLGISMRRKAAEGDQTESLFAFTFTEEGTYVFHDAAERQRILVITVKGAGEKCADPDRYVQTVSGESLAEVGIQIEQDLLLRPNFPLIGAALGLLVFSTIIILCFFAYCLRKGWTIQDLQDQSYKDLQLPQDLAHTREDLFDKENDFQNYKSELIDSDEDDLDKLNLDIQQELVEAGRNYIKTWAAKKRIHKKEKQNKRNRIEQILDEIDEMTGGISNDALENNMRWMDVDNLEELNLDDEQIREKVHGEIEAEKAREEKEAEKYADQKDQLYQEMSDRERAQFEAIQAKMNQDIADSKKELNAVDDDGQIHRGETQAYAIYDGGNVNSKANQIVKRIDLTQDLSEEDRQRLLRSHEDNLQAVEDALNDDRRRQQQELDRALKERLEKRKNAKRKLNSKDLQLDLQETTDLINDEFGGRKGQVVAELDEDLKNSQEQIYAAKLSGPEQAQELRDVVAGHEEIKRQRLKDLEAERKETIEAKKKEISALYLAGAKDDDDLKNQLQDLLGADEATMNSIIAQTNQDKADAENELKRRLEERRLAKERKLKQKQEEFNQELEEQDPEDYEMIEAKNYEETKKLEDKMATEQAAAGEPQADGHGAFDSKNTATEQLANSISGKKGGMAAAFAKALAKKVEIKAEEERKRIARDRHHDMALNFDLQLAQSSLMAQLAEGDEQMARDLAEEKQMQDAKLRQRRELLKARRKNKQAQAMEEQRIKDKIDLIEEEQTAKKEINEEYLRQLFKRSDKSDNETPEEKQQRLDLLNEYLSDQFMERLSALLTKQFVEKEAKMKALVNKYMDDKLAETTAVKGNFKVDYEKLEELKENDQLDEAAYTSAKKQLRLKEQNLIRSIELQIEKNQKEEDSLLRAELEKKHNAEQVEFRKNVAEEQARLRKSLIQDAKLCSEEQELDKKVLEKYAKNKQDEEAKKLRRIELQKKTIAGQIDAELKNKYGSFDEMLSRQQKEKIQMADQTESLKQKLNERKERMKMRPRDEGLTDEQKEALMNDYKLQLEQLDSAFDAERARQRLYMSQKARAREQGLMKKREAKAKAEAEAQKNAAKSLKKLFGRSETLVIDDDAENSRLMQKLRQWKVMKKEYENTQFQKKVSTTGVTLDDKQYKLMILKLMKVERLIKELDQKSKKVDGRVDAIFKEGQAIDSNRDSSSNVGNRYAASRAGTRRMSQMSGRAGTQFGGRKLTGH